MTNEDQMRGFIFLAESLNEDTAQVEPIVEEVVEAEPAQALLMHDLGDLVFRLRGFMETEGGEYALGVETGMQRAADMIENLLRRHSEGDHPVE